MEAVLYDVCVIGSGVNGSSAAYSLAKQSKKVLLLEQFPIPHNRGSSHGQTRVVRSLYKQYDYAKMSGDSFPLWEKLEEEANEKLLILNGNMQFYGPSHYDELKEFCASIDKINAKYEVVESGNEFNKRYPLFNIPEDTKTIIEPGGGTILASKAVLALQKIFVLNHGVLRDGEKVIKIVPGDIIQIKTDQSTYNAKSIIIACGPYTKTLTEDLGLHLPLQVVRAFPCYWKLKDESANNDFPCYIRTGLPIYGLPSIEYPGLVKICDHHGIEADINYPDDIKPDLEGIKYFIRTYMKGVEDRPSIIENCFYTNTPDRHFIIDLHPHHTNIVIAAGFSGTGFKMAPVTGRILADLSLGRTPTYDISMFRMSRFHGVVKDKKSLL